MLDSSIIGRAVRYGDYPCIIDNILDYKEGVVQLSKEYRYCERWEYWKTDCICVWERV